MGVTHVLIVATGTEGVDVGIAPGGALLDASPDTGFTDGQQRTEQETDQASSERRKAHGKGHLHGVWPCSKDDDHWLAARAEVKSPAAKRVEVVFNMVDREDVVVSCTRRTEVLRRKG